MIHKLVVWLLDDRIHILPRSGLKFIVFECHHHHPLLKHTHKSRLVNSNYNFGVFQFKLHINKSFISLKNFVHIEMGNGSITNIVFYYIDK